jgi:CBS domain-containing protein
MELSRSLRNDCVKDLSPRAALTVSPDTSVEDAIALLQREEAGCVIISLDGTPAGIFTERDVLRRVIGEQVDLQTPITTVMTTDLAVVKGSDPITLALDLLHRRGLRHLPVLDDAGQLAGILSVRRVMEYLVEHFPEAVYNLPPNPSASLQSREGA